MPEDVLKTALNKYFRYFDDSKLSVVLPAFSDTSDNFDYLISLFKRANSNGARREISIVLSDRVRKERYEEIMKLFSGDAFEKVRESALCTAIRFGDICKIKKFLNDKDGHIRKKAERYFKK